MHPLCVNNKCGSDDGCKGICPNGSCHDSSDECKNGVCTPSTGDTTCASLYSKYGGDPNVKFYCGTDYGKYCFDTVNKVFSAIGNKDDCFNSNMIWCTY